MTTIRYYLSYIFIFLCGQIMAQPSVSEVNHCQLHEKDNAAAFIPNKKQWPANVKFMAPVGGKKDVVWFEDKRLRYQFHHPEDVSKLHDMAGTATENIKLRQHSYQVDFLNAQEATIVATDPQTAYLNYLKGNDPDQWAKRVPLFHELDYQQLYDGIDLHFHYQNGHLKYEYQIQPHVNPAQIQMKYTGADRLYIRKNTLIIETAVQTIQEMPPVAFQKIKQKIVKVACEYRLENDILSFSFPDGYDDNYALTIDPEVVAATMTGTFGEQNFGHTATFDHAGNIYAGGISFGVGYPTTLGAYNEFFNGGERDVVISKYNPTGTQLIYATYLGGIEDDYPHSLITDVNQRLYIYGSTESPDFPTTNAAIQSNHGGEADIFVTILQADGSDLVGSTYLGGSNNDGRNDSYLNSNYGDVFRGEIVIDDENNIYVASCTQSFNFPTTDAAFDRIFNGTSEHDGVDAQDGLVFKMNSDASLLYWSTYLGGDNADAALGLRVDKQTNVYVTGYAGAANFPTFGNVLHPTWLGGEENGFITKIAPAGDAVMLSTFWGSSDGNEHSYFIDVDEDHNINVYGQTTGTMPITPNTYASAVGSKQFISGFNRDLSEVLYSTVIGVEDGPDGNGYDFVPVAFMVNKCDHIYFSGYYAAEGLPLTNDALETEGNAFYLGVLEPYATSLSFGTYYGRANHVDGGTSRFDKGGIVYQCVCSCDFDESFMNTNNDAWATNQSTRCDMGVFKIDFGLVTVTAATTVMPSTSGCAPFTIDLEYTGQDATAFYWYFDENASSTLESPTHTFEDPGTYEIYLVASNPDACNQPDTNFITINVLDSESVTQTIPFCDEETLYLDVSLPNANYQWQDGFDGSTYTVMEEGTYFVEISTVGCSYTDTFYVSSELATFPSIPDTAVCDATILINATHEGATNYTWSTGETGPSITVLESGDYLLTITDEDNCVAYDTINVLLHPSPTPNLGDDRILCDETALIDGFNEAATTYLWSTGANDSSINITESGLYALTITDENNCMGEDEINITLDTASILDLGADVSVCDVEFFTIDGTTDDATTYLWSTGESTAQIDITENGTYTLMASNANDCMAFDTIQIEFGAAPVPDLGDDLILCDAENFSIDGTTNNATSYLWSTGETFANIDLTASGTYSITVSNDNNCVAYDTVQIEFITAPVLDLGDDITVCDVETFTINGTVDNATNYLWSTNETTPQIDITQNGNYILMASNVENCAAFDTIQVEFDTAPLPELGEDLVFCDVESFTINGTTDNATNYLWSTGETSANIDLTTSGTYSIAASNDNNCVGYDTIQVEFDTAPLPDLGEDLVFCDVETFTINGTTNNATNYLWSTGQTSANIELTASGTYFMMASNDNNCVGYDTIQIEFDTAPLPDLGEDLALCDVESFTINGTTNNATNYLWSTGETSANIELTASGTYSIIVSNDNNCVGYDTVQVSLNTSPILDLGEDISICDTSSIIIDGTTNATTYLWSTGESTPTLSISTSGNYMLTAENNGCNTSDEIWVEIYPSLDINAQITAFDCDDACSSAISILTNGGTGDFQYEWNTGATTANLGDLCPGNYSLTLTDSGLCDYFYETELIAPNLLEMEVTWQDLACAGDASGWIEVSESLGGVAPYLYSLDGENYTSEITFNNLAAGDYTIYLQDAQGCLMTQDVQLSEPFDFFVDVGEDTSIKLGESIRLHGQIFPFLNQEFYWETEPSLSCEDCLITTATPMETTAYTFVAIDTSTGCIAADTVMVQLDKVRDVYIPNAFSPNDDGVNDYFTIYTSVGVKQVQNLQIFDRWGNLVFQNNDFAPNIPKWGWNGTYQEELMNSNVFVYHTTIEFLDGVVVLYKGSVTLVR